MTYISSHIRSHSSSLKVQTSIRQQRRQQQRKSCCSTSCTPPCLLGPNATATTMIAAAALAAAPRFALLPASRALAYCLPLIFQCYDDDGSSARAAAPYLVHIRKPMRLSLDIKLPDKLNNVSKMPQSCKWSVNLRYRTVNMIVCTKSARRSQLTIFCQKGEKQQKSNAQSGWAYWAKIKTLLIMAHVPMKD
jgi:hypothetical protein